MNVVDLATQVHYRANGGPDYFYETTFTSEAAYTAVTWAIELVSAALLRGETVALKGLGTFKVVKRKERTYPWGFHREEREYLAAPERANSYETTIPAHLEVVV